MTALKEVSVRFVVEFDDSQLKRGARAVEKVEDKLEDETKATKKATEETGKFVDGLKTLGTALLTGAAIRGLIGFIDHITEAADVLGNTSTRLGVSAQDFQVFSLAASRAGISSEEMADSMKDLQLNLGRAATDETAAQMFTDLGVQIRDTNGDLLSNAEVLRNVATAMGNIENPAQRAAALTNIMGEAGGRLAPVFENGAASINEASRRLEELGGGTSQGAIDVSARLATAWGDQEVALNGAYSAIIEKLAPALIKLIDFSTEVIGWLIKFEEETGMVSEIVIALGIAMTAMAIKATIAAGSFIAAWAAAAGPFLILGAVVAAVALVIQEMINYIKTGTGPIADMIDMFEGWAKSIQEVVDSVKEFFGLDTSRPSTAQVENPAFVWNVPDEPEQQQEVSQRNRNRRQQSQQSQEVSQRNRNRRQQSQQSIATRERQTPISNIPSTNNNIFNMSRPMTSTTSNQTTNNSVRANNTINLNISGQGLNERQVAELAAREVTRVLDTDYRNALGDGESNG